MEETGILDNPSLSATVLPDFEPGQEKHNFAILPLGPNRKLIVTSAKVLKLLL